MNPLGKWEGHDAEYWRRAWGAGSVALFQTTESTNDTAARLALDGAPDFSVVIAEEQTRGRGRGASTWSAAPGTSLLFSVLFRTAQPGHAPGCAPIRIGLAVASAISNARVKWPNDVVIPGHGKLAGILCEGVFGSHVVAGVGINVTQSREDFPVELRERACSIVSATAVSVDRAALLTEILRSMQAVAGRLTDPLTAEEVAEFSRYDLLKDSAVVCEADNLRTFQGTAHGIAEDGALLVATATGIERVYNATVRMANENAYPGTLGMT